MVSSGVKYWVIAGVTAAIDVLTYLTNSGFQVTESVTAGAVILVLGLVVHDLEDEPTTTPTPPKA